LSKLSIAYRLPGACWSLEFSEPALQAMLDHAQYSRLSKESVGQLFVRNLKRDAHLIEAATILTPTRDASARVTFSTARAMDKRESFYSKRLHCIGLWHTHPEPSPVPSADDCALAREHALAARPHLGGIVFVIVGTAPRLKVFASGLTTEVPCVRLPAMASSAQTYDRYRGV